MQTQQHLPFPTPSFPAGPFLCMPSPGRWELVPALLPWGSLLGAQGPCAPLRPHDAAASLGASVMCGDGYFAVAGTAGC